MKIITVEPINYIFHCRTLKKIFLGALSFSFSCSAFIETEPRKTNERNTPTPQYFVTAEQTHNRFSSTIEPVLRVPSGAIIEAHTQEATGQQLNIHSTATDWEKVDTEQIHALTGPVFIEGAAVGDVLAVTLHEIEIGEWGWSAILPGFGFLSDQFQGVWLRTFELGSDISHVQFNERFQIPVKPFPGVMGVAPATSEMLSTIPPRSNGGNMDDPNIVAGTTVYFPIFVDGALFSIGDTHAVQGMGEVCGTAVEAPMRIIYEVRVLKDTHPIKEPQYETDDYYAVTAFATTIDEAARKATLYMIDYLENMYEMERQEAYVLCSLAGNLKIAAVVDIPHMFVAMHMPKTVLNGNR